MDMATRMAIVALSKGTGGGAPNKQSPLIEHAHHIQRNHEHEFVRARPSKNVFNGVNASTCSAEPRIGLKHDLEPPYGCHISSIYQSIPLPSGTNSKPSYNPTSSSPPNDQNCMTVPSVNPLISFVFSHRNDHDTKTAYLRSNSGLDEDVRAEIEVRRADNISVLLMATYA